MHPAVRPAISFLLISLSVLGLINVYGDNSDVESLAIDVACPGCEGTITRMERTPISQTFHIQTEKNGVVIVECRKAAIFVGDPSCRKQ